MRECTFISKAALGALLLWAIPASMAWAQPVGGASPANPKDSRTTLPEDDDFTSTPFTEYGTFNEDEEEEEETRFFQSGRFFGVSLGLGMQFVDGNRGRLWQGGFPVLDFRVHYWFDQNLALNLGFYTVQHNYDTPSTLTGGQWNVSFFRIGVDIKYYFDVQNLSAPITFANPFILIGGSQYSKSEKSSTGLTENSSAFGVNLGAGLEFAIKPKKAYFQLEGRMHFPGFDDANDGKFAATDLKLDNLNGHFYTLTGSFLFTW